MKKPKTGTRMKTAASIPGFGLNVQLTVAERDAIDGAKTRIRDVVVVARDLAEHGKDSPLHTLFEVIGDSVEVIDSVFQRADDRKGGAR